MKSLIGHPDSDPLNNHWRHTARALLPILAREFAADAARIKQLEGFIERTDDAFSDAVQADCENGVRWLNERAARAYLKDAPATFAAIRAFQDKVGEVLGDDQ